MSSEFFPINTLKMLLTHHISMLERYDISDREFSLIYFDFGKYKDNIEIKRVIQTVFRDCDVIFEIDGNYIIFLPKISWQDSYKILKELREFLDQDVKDTIVTYPEDGKNADELIESLKKIVKENHDIELNI